MQKLHKLFFKHYYKQEIKIENELEWIRKITNNPADYRCAILVDGVYVGNIYLTGIDGITAHYHIFIGNKEYWGKGIAKKTSQLILCYAFNTLNLESVQLRVRKENTKALILYKNWGLYIYKRFLEIYTKYNCCSF